MTASVFVITHLYRLAQVGRWSRLAIATNDTAAFGGHGAPNQLAKAKADEENWSILRVIVVVLVKLYDVERLWFVNARQTHCNTHTISALGAFDVAFFLLLCLWLAAAAGVLCW